MRTRLLLVSAMLALALPAHAVTLHGRVLEGTSGTNADGLVVELLDFAAGSTPVARAQTKDGRFEITGVEVANAAHYMLRTEYSGVEYLQPLDREDPEKEVVFEVYQTTDERESIELARHHVLFQREGEHIVVTELLEYSNATDPPRTIRAEARPMRLHLPPRDVHGEIEVSVGSGALPVRKELVDTGELEISGIDAPLRPGITRAIVRYSLHDETPFHWHAKAVYAEQDRRVLVSPPDIQAEVAQMVPTDSPLEGFAAWQGLPLPAGADWSVILSGGSKAAGTPTTAVQRVEVVPNRLSEGALPIAIAMTATLLLGLLIGLRGTPAPVNVEVDAQRQKISRLADRYVSGEIDRETFERERDRILAGKATKKKRRKEAGSRPTGARVRG